MRDASKNNAAWDRLKDMPSTIGLGVAGNFTGHLEQAGEASDFRNVSTDHAAAPKGIFPFYVPGGGQHFLNTMPVSATSLALGSKTENHQIEPEVALLCHIQYAEKRVASLTPLYAMAHNDCSIRRPGALKISEKKNWGPETKGTSNQMISLDRFEKGGILDDYRVACFLLRDGVLVEYGLDSSVTGYSYYGTRLVDWLIEKMNNQQDQGPLEHIAHWLDVASQPDYALISIGATRYTDFGENTFLKSGDVASVILYDAKQHTQDAIRGFADGSKDTNEPGLSVLRQNVHLGSQR